MKYFANSAHHEYEYNIEETSEGYELISKDGVIYQAELTPLQNNRFSLILNNESFIVNAVNQNGKYTILIRGKQIEIDVNDEKNKAWKKIIEQSAPKTAAGLLNSPMPGLVVKILVKEGDLVTKGQGIIILSAMKMENELKANATGKIVKIFTEEGVAVEKGAKLLEIV